MSGGGQADAFVVRFAPDGTHVWSKGFGDAEFQEARGVAIDNTGQVIVGGAFWGTVDLGGGAFTSAGRDDLFLAKFTSGGTHIWSRQYGDANAARSFDIATDSGRNIVMTGVFSGDLDFGGGTVASGGSNDVFVAKIGP